VGGYSKQRVDREVKGQGSNLPEEEEERR